jgi:hypothetical protein
MPAQKQPVEKGGFPLRRLGVYIVNRHHLRTTLEKAKYSREPFVTARANLISRKG